MNFLKYLTPFIWMFPFCIYLSFRTWLGDFSAFNLPPSRSVLFVSIGFTMLIVDLFLKYLIGKDRIAATWITELVLLGILAVMIIPRVQAVLNGY